MSAGCAGPEVWENRDQKSCRAEKVGEDFDGFRREVAPPDKIGQGGPRAEKGRGASPTVHNTNPSVIAIGIFARGAIRVSLALSNTRGVKLSLLSLCALISLPPCT